MTFDKVWAFGRDTYVRFYPNPGVGVRFFKWRVTLSWYRGFELFVKRGDWRLKMRRFNRKLERV